MNAPATAYVLSAASAMISAFLFLLVRRAFRKGTAGMGTVLALAFGFLFAMAALTGWLIPATGGAW